MENKMKAVYAITEKRQEGQKEPKHVLFGIDKNNLDYAKLSTEARQKVSWDNFIWGLFCTEKTYEYIKKHLIFSGFDPYEIEDAIEIHLIEMKYMHFYKEIIMLKC